ncbi:PH domain-containing protein [Propionimicrobium lymphophilum]|uniref:YdbS-like PH domain-containing protein n=1 Tax=Propionimicrobium lymphophilum ACS-093-V-SCH5 TaxID=883161 RepID=S2WME4_9ACTN|nr:MULTISPECIES: PH domain-containing protein [Propionimicrobium]EPD33837.1 hypothetical protein HMPREF9306_00252 [Propionimicrobium lymphophilum ACS-093-V-SCH5]ETJ97398.1 PH domain protein [Propionimicrobium sp. BV2F7]MDK7710736.1 PH domain-containing protein [Propionimicrobium lymphophilum]MDK7733656.1 PH domain-containing protein [Propionimicrobium lymphophilum]
MASFLDPDVEQYLLLDEGEILVDEIGRHWVTRVIPVLTILAGAAFFGLIPSFANIWLVPFVISFALVCRGAWKLAQEQVDRFVVTNMRVFRVNGVFNRHLAIVPIARILDISVSRPFLGLILGYGHFIFESAAQEQGLRNIKFVPHILVHDKTIQTIIARSGVRARAELTSDDLDDLNDGT